MTLMDQSNLEIDYDFGVTATTIIMDDAEDLELGINWFFISVIFPKMSVKMMVGFYYASERVIGQHDSRSSERANYKKMSTVTTDKWTTVVGTLLGSKSNRFPTRK